MFHQIMSLYVAGFWIFLVVLTALAWVWRGVGFGEPAGRYGPELQVAALFWSAAILTAILRPSLGLRFIEIERAVLLVDIGLFAGLSWVGARSGKVWVLCAAAFQLVSTTAHFARLVTPGMFRLGYQVMEEASSYPTLALLAWGIASRRVAARRGARSRISSGGPARGSTRGS